MTEATTMYDEDRARLLAEIRAAQDDIDAAYWRFTRQARAKPPSMQVPDAYRRKGAALKALRELDQVHRTATTEDRKETP